MVDKRPPGRLSIKVLPVNPGSTECEGGPGIYGTQSKTKGKGADGLRRADSPSGGVRAMSDTWAKIIRGVVAGIDGTLVMTAVVAAHEAYGDTTAVADDYPREQRLDVKRET